MLKYFYKKDDSKGFTLIELLVVIAIIGVLASIVLASLSSARKKGRDSKRVGDLRSLQLALELYFDANKAYPATGWVALNTALTGTNCGGASCISATPTDPLNSGNQIYAYTSCGSPVNDYVLSVTLEESTNVAYGSDYDGPPPVCAVTCTDPLYCLKP